MKTLTQLFIYLLFACAGALTIFYGIAGFVAVYMDADLDLSVHLAATLFIIHLMLVSTILSGMVVLGVVGLEICKLIAGVIKGRDSDRLARRLRELRPAHEG